MSVEVLVARSAGFCMGVRRAIELAVAVASEEGRLVHTYGPLIHNPQALAELRERGILALDEADPVPSGAIVVRAHGVTPAVLERLAREADRVVDATCPKVERIQKQIEEYGARGYAVVIAGDADHPEVVGLLGHARGEAFVVSGPDDIAGLPPLGRVVLVAQTTQDEELYTLIRERLTARFPEAKALSTICESTHRRQSEARKLASKVDAMVVIGGRNSANTRRLAEICEALGRPTYLVETAGELPLGELRRLTSVGVTAGASTPVWIIDEVVRALEAL